MSMGLDPIRDLRGVGIDQYRAGLGEYLNAVASDAWANSPVMQGVGLLRAGIADEEARDRGEQLMSPQEASEQGRDLGLRFDAPISRGAFDVLAEDKRHEAAAELTFKRARLENGYGTLHWLLGGGAEFLTMAVDPLNLASAFVPVVGEARFAAMASRIGRFPAALAKGAAEGAVGQAMLEPLNAAAKFQRGDDYTALDTLTSLAFGGGLGVVLHGAGYGIGAGFRFMRDRYRVAETPRPADAGSPLVPVRAFDEPATPHEARAVAVERIDEPPPRQPVAEQMERLRPETKDAAMRSAIAQLAQDRPVDIEPVLRADPSWPEIKAAIDAGHAEVPELQRQSVQSQALPSLDPPPHFQPSPEELKLAQRVSRGWEPEVPLRQPQSLVDFVRKSGGLIDGTPEAAELRAADIGRQPGLLRPRENGRQADHMAQAAAEHGFRLGREGAIGSGVDTDAFVKALIEDASGRRKHFPDDAHTSAWQVQQDYFAQFHDYLQDHLGLKPKGMEPRQLAWLLAQDRDTARLMTLVAAVDRLGPDGSLELAARLDAERARMTAEILDAEPGALEPDAPKADHRDTPARTLEELERFYADHKGAAGPDQAGERPAGPQRPAGGGSAEGGEAPPAGSARRGDPAEAPGLRRQGDAEGGAGPDQGTARDLGPPTPEAPPTAADLARFAERQQQSDLHADPAALAARDERLATEARETAQLLQDDLRDHGHLLDGEARELFDATGRVFDDEAKAIDALASCRIGGG